MQNKQFQYGYFWALNLKTIFMFQINTLEFLETQNFVQKLCGCFWAAIVKTILIF